MNPLGERETLSRARRIHRAAEAGRRGAPHADAVLGVVAIDPSWVEIARQIPELIFPDGTNTSQWGPEAGPLAGYLPYMPEVDGLDLAPLG